MPFKPAISKELIGDIIAALLLVLFLYTGAHKLMDHQNFYLSLRSIAYIKPWVKLIAWTIPIIELIVSALLLWHRTRKTGTTVSIILLVCFTLYIILLKSFSPHLPCTCGGVISSLTWTQHLWFNVGCIVLACVGAYCLRKVD